MFIHFYYINIKKEKNNYIMIYRHSDEYINFTHINSILYKINNNIDINSEISKSINFYE